MHLYIKLAFCLALLTDKLSQPSEKKSGTSIIAGFGDNSDSTILKFSKFLTKLLGQAIPCSAAIIEVWLDKTFAYFNCSVH